MQIKSLIIISFAFGETSLIKISVCKFEVGLVDYIRNISNEKLLNKMILLLVHLKLSIYDAHLHFIKVEHFLNYQRQLINV